MIGDNNESTFSVGSTPNPGGPPPAKMSKNPGFGYSGGPPQQHPKGHMQWTPEGWVVKDNSHKV